MQICPIFAGPVTYEDDRKKLLYACHVIADQVQAKIDHWHKVKRNTHDHLAASFMAKIFLGKEQKFQQWSKYLEIFEPKIFSKNTVSLEQKKSQ